MQRRHGATAADPFALLGVKPSATAEVITSAFRARVRELRPDIHVDAVTAERFGRLRSAYDTLRDPGLRAAHDRERAVPPRLRPALRGVAAVRMPGTVPPPEPPLRAGPVRWERSRWSPVASDASAVPRTSR